MTAPEGFFMVTHANMEALLGAGPLAMAVYMVLLSVTDTKTGRAGGRSGVSRQMLRERTERVVRRGAGFQTVFQATDKELRTALDELERRLLIAREGSADSLVFRMAGAATQQVRPKRTGPSSGPGTGPGQSQAGQGFAGSTGPGTGPNTGPSSRIPNTSLLSTSSHPEPSVMESELRDDRELANDPFAGLAMVPDQVGGYLAAIGRLGWSTAGALGAEATAILQGFLAAGVSIAVLVRADALTRAKGGRTTLYLLKAAQTLVEGDEALAAAQPSAGGQMLGLPWHQSWSGIERKARELGVVRAIDEDAQAFKYRVFAQAGHTLEEHRKWTEVRHG